MTETPRPSAGGAAGHAPVTGDQAVSVRRSTSALAYEAEDSPTGSRDGDASTKTGDTAVGDKAKPSENDRSLGAGGSFVASDRAEEPEATQGPGSGVAKAAAVGAAIPAAGVAGQVLVLMMFLNWLKGLMATLLALVQNLWNLAMSLLLGAGKWVAGSIMAIGTTVSTALGGAVSAAAAGVTSVTAGGLAVVFVLTTAVTMIGDNLGVKDVALASCTTQAETALNEIEGSNGAVDQQTRANAQTIYSVLSAWGMPNENIAGIIGNWDAESGVDPTSVQNHFTSPQRMSDEKRSAATNTDNGIGLGQWTFGRNTNLRAYADTLGKDWWTLEVQLGFMLSAAEGSDAAVVKDMIATSYGTPASAAAHFHDAWERSADTAAMAARRGTYATKWMGLFGGWTADKALADSILAQAGTTVSGANGARAEEVRSNCKLVEPAAEWVADGTAPGAWGGFSNGKIPQSALMPIPWADQGPLFLRSDAVAALTKLNAEFRAQFGYDLTLNDAYRDYANQVQARSDWCALGKCQNAATPGTSNHGWALAIDIGQKNHTVIGFGSPEYAWLKANAGKYGWVHPKYMEPGGSGPFEAWHWEYYGVA